MACVRIRRGKPVLDYRDKWGKRRWLTFPNTPEGIAAAEAEKQRIERGAPEISPGITLGEYIEWQWLPLIGKRHDPATVRSYEICTRLHLSRDLLRTRLRDVTRPMLKRHLLCLVDERGVGEPTVIQVAKALCGIFDCAIDDELVTANPAHGLRRSLGLSGRKDEKVRAMTAEQLDAFMEAVSHHEPKHLLEFAILAYAGLRVGEMRGLQLDDLQMDARVMLVERQVHSDGRVGALKGPKGKKRPRIVDLSDALHALLVPALASRRECDMRWGTRGPWLLYPEWDKQPGSVGMVASRTRQAMNRALRHAKLPHFTPHSLRHTYATLMLEGGEDLLYVSRQMGHSTTRTTEHPYGSSARVRPRAGGANLLTVSRG